MHQRGLGKYAPHRAQARPAHLRHHDVRLWRRAASPRQSFRAHSPHPGRHWRLHCVTSVDFRFGQHAARQKSSGNYRSRLSENARSQPPLSRQHRSHPIQLAHTRHKSLPGRPAIRRRRRRQHSDRRKRCVRRRRPQPHQRIRTPPRHFRRRLHPRTARHSVSLLRAEVELYMPNHEFYRKLIQNNIDARTEHERIWQTEKRKSGNNTQAYQASEEARRALYRQLEKLYETCLTPLRDPFLAGESPAIDEIVTFIEVDLPGFRTGYDKEWFLTKLKKLKLS